MVNYIPEYEQNSKVFKEILYSQEKEFDEKYRKLEDILLQMNIDTATWGLDVYEKELNIKKNVSKSYDDRRSIIKSKFRGIAKIDKALIKLIAESYINGNVDVDFNGKIKIKFNNVYGIPKNIGDLKLAIEEIKPAHLRIMYEFCYLLIKDIHSVVTINEIQNIKLNLFAGGDIYGN